MDNDPRDEELLQHLSDAPYCGAAYEPVEEGSRCGYCGFTPPYTGQDLFESTTLPFGMIMIGPYQRPVDCTW